MPRCKWCNTWALLSLSEHGLCKNCETAIALNTQQRSRIIGESIELIVKTKKMDTAISRFKLLTEHLQEIAKYEQKGIQVLEKMTPEILRNCREHFDKAVVAMLMSDCDQAKAKSEVAQTTKTKIAPISKMLVKIQRYMPELHLAALLGGLETDLMHLLYQTTLDGFLEAAKKAEFMGKEKKALEQYYEALYFLRNDDIDDKFQAEHISEVETKIRDLGGEISGG